MRPASAIMKKNVLSIICGVVALVAIIAVFWPISGYFTALQTEVDARKSAYQTATTLLKKSRTLPVLDPLSTDPVPLPGFPTEGVIARGSLAQKAISDESAAMLGTATKLVIHQPLVPNALPSGGNIDANAFLNQYQHLMTFPSVDPEQAPNTLPVSILHAWMPPTDAEIKAEQDSEKDEITKTNTHLDSSGQPINAPEVEALVEAAIESVPSEMRLGIARKNQMYIAPDAYHLNPALTGVNPPSTVEMFNGQIGLWLLRDVFSALASANADLATTASPTTQSATSQPGDDVPAGVQISRVKHLLKIDFLDDLFKPAYTTDPSATPPVVDALHPPRMLNMSPTGHVSNGLYDVIPFSLKIIVDAHEVPAVLAALSKDRFITVLRMDLLTVDSGQAILAGFEYGDKPVVQLNLSCEELFFRADIAPYMPDPIKKSLGIAPPPAAPGT